MKPAGTILLVDDDPRFAEVYREQLAADGHDVDVAGTVDGALAALDASTYDLVILDRKLQGRAGPDSGLDLLAEVRRRAPATRVILITAFADSESVKRAFDDGVYEYLEKNAYFDEILRVKIANALEAVRERRFAALANGKREEAIVALWSDARSEKDSHRKGRLLEDLVLLLWKSVPGFERAEVNLRSVDEQFDVVVPNESEDPLWRKEQSQYFLVECKNWSTKVEPSEIDRLQEKLARRRGRIRLGFLVAPGGFTSGVDSTLAASRKDREMVVPVDAEDLDALVHAGSPGERNARLKAIHRRATIGV